MLRKLFIFISLVVPLHVYSGIQVPIAAYNHPWVGMPAGWGDQKDYYRAMLDSAINCGLGYFKPGGVRL